MCLFACRPPSCPASSQLGLYASAATAPQLKSCAQLPASFPHQPLATHTGTMLVSVCQHDPRCSCFAASLQLPAPTSRLSLATHTGTTLCASTSWKGTEAGSAADTWGARCCRGQGIA